MKPVLYLFMGMFCLITSSIKADTISVLNISGCTGDSVQVVVSISNPAIPVDSFGFRLNYDSTALSYTGCAAGSLNPGWMVFNCNPSSGYIVVGGFSLSGIPAGSTGSLAILNFNVACTSCTSGQTFPLTLSNLVDDLVPFTSIDGIFTFQCPTATTTATPSPSLTPNPSDTPEPTNSPTPSVTPTETETPESTATSIASTTAAPEMTLTPTPTEVPTIPTSGHGSILLMMLLISIAFSYNLKRRSR